MPADGLTNPDRREASGTSAILDFFLVKLYGWEYFEGLRKNNILTHQSCDQANLLASGERLIDLCDHQVTAPAHAHGMPVLATRVGTFPAQVRDGVDGVLADPGDVGSLIAGLRRLADPGELARLEDGIPEVDLRTPWRAYVAALTGAALPAVGSSR